MKSGWHIAIAVVVAWVLTGVMYAWAEYAGIVEDVSQFELFGIATAFVCTYLCVIQNRLQVPFGIASVVSFAFLFYELDLMGSVVLQLYLVPVLLYTWVKWGDGDNGTPITSLRFDHWLLGFIAAVLGTWVLVVGVLQYGFDSTLPAFDSAILVLSIAAQYLLTCKKLQTWIVWAVVNVISIYVYYRSGAVLVAIQYCMFLANTIFGYVLWRKSYAQRRRSDDRLAGN